MSIVKLSVPPFPARGAHGLACSTSLLNGIHLFPDVTPPKALGVHMDVDHRRAA